jgi:hypothetical protein
MRIAAIRRVFLLPGFFAKPGNKSAEHNRQGKARRRRQYEGAASRRNAAMAVMFGAYGQTDSEMT